MTAAMGTTFSDPAPRRGVLAAPAADALVTPTEPDDETPDEEIDEKASARRARKRQRPPAKRSDR